MNILLIDDDQGLRKNPAARAGNDAAPRHRSVRRRRRAKAYPGHSVFDVAFLDLRLGRDKGLDVLPAPAPPWAPELAVVVVTAHATIETAVEAMAAERFELPSQAFPVPINSGSYWIALPDPGVSGV